MEKLFKYPCEACPSETICYFQDRCPLLGKYNETEKEENEIEIEGCEYSEEGTNTAGEKVIMVKFEGIKYRGLNLDKYYIVTYNYEVEGLKSYDTKARLFKKFVIDSLVDYIDFLIVLQQEGKKDKAIKLETQE